MEESGDKDDIDNTYKHTALPMSIAEDYRI